MIERAADALGWMKKSAASGATGLGSGADPFSIWRTSKKIDGSKALDSYTGWTYACIRAIAEEISKTKFKLMRVKKNGDEEEVDSHELLDLLDGVNEGQTGIELRYLTAAHLEAIGNSYWLLVNKRGEPVSSAEEKPDAIHILNASQIKVIVDRNALPARITKYEYRTATKVYTLETYQLIHLKNPDPQDQFEGIGTVQTIAQWIDADNYAMEFNRRFFLNGARIGGFLEAQQAYATDQLEYLKKSFESAYKGVENAHKVLALPVGVKYSEAQNTQKEMDFPNLMTMMRDRILAGFRVPRTALGITDDVNRANAEATDYVFAARTILPKIEQLTAFLNEYLVPRFGQDLYLTFEDPVPENRAQSIEEMKAALGGAPALSVNEARAKYFGEDPVDGGDLVQKPFNMIDLSEPDHSGDTTPPAASDTPAAADTPAEPTKAIGRRTVRGRRVKTRFARNAEKRKEISEALGEKAAEVLERITKAVSETKQNRSIGQLSDDQFEPIYLAFAKRVATYESRMRHAVREFNGKQKKVVLDNLGEIVGKHYNASTKAIAESALFDSNEWIGILVSSADPILTDLFKTEGKEAASLLGFDLDPLTPEQKVALDSSIELMSKAYNAETLQLLKSKLEQGIGEGMGLDELSGLVSDVYEFSDEVRADRVATTETFRVANESTKAAYKQTGVVKTIKWYTAADERVCPFCSPMHGKVISIDENFFDKGDTIKGADGSEMTADYADVGTPPIHVSCRCYTRPEDISLE